MSFPYHQYVDYSNPATPRVYSWEVPSEQDALQMQQQQQDQAALQQQHQQQQHQQQQQQVEQQQQERVSPSQLQLQQLPPPPPPLLTPQDVQHQQQRQNQQQQQQQAQYTPHPQTINLQPATSQPQYRFDNITEEYFTQAAQAGGETRPGSSSSSRRRGTSKPPLHVDTSRPASSVASPSALSSTGTGVGPLRAPPTRAHAQSAHPYRRPQSRTASGGSSTRGASVGASGSAPVRTRRVSEMHAAQTSAGGALSGTSMPAVGTAMAVSCPASDSWKEGLLGLSEGAGQEETSHDPETTPTGTNRVQTYALPAEPMRRYGIRADIHYNMEENVIIAVFELPGVKRNDLRITMSMCPFTRVRQINIAGISRPVLPSQGHGVRERKYGQFMRTLAVPPETKPKDVQITLEDGVLTLKIPGGTPAEAEEPQELAIP